MMRYYRSAAGGYLGAWDTGLAPPPGAVEVPHPPLDARAAWQGEAWIEPDPEPPLIPLAIITFRLAAMGKLAAVAAALDGAPSALAALLTLQQGIYANDPQARALLTAAGADPDVILAP